MGGAEHQSREGHRLTILRGRSGVGNVGNRSRHRSCSGSGVARPAARIPISNIVVLDGSAARRAWEPFPRAP